MKKLIFLVMAVAAFFAFYEQQKAESNVYITVIAIAVFMIGMMWLSSKTPSKNQNQDGNDIQ